MGVLIPLLIAFLSVAATVLGARWVGNRDKALIRLRTGAEARHVAAQLRFGLLGAFEPLQRIAAWWLLQGRPLAPEDWENDAKLFINTAARLQMVVWLDPKDARSWTVRPGSQPRLATVTTRDPALLSALAAARSTNATAVSPVFELDGKAMVYACSPVRKQERLIGYIAGLYDAEQLVRSLLQNQLPDEYSIAVTAGDWDFHVPPVRKSKAPAEFHLRQPVPVANAVWAVTVAPSGIGISTLQQSVMSFGVLASALLFVCAVIARTSRRRASDLETVNARLVIEAQERRRAEERAAGLNRELQQKLEEFQTLLEVLPIGIAVAEDPECRRIWTNRAMAAMLKLPQNQNISQSVPEAEKPHYRTLRNGRDVPPDELPMQVAARTKSPVANDYLDIVRQDGSVLHTLSYSAPLFDESAEVRGVINACIDITERKLLSDRLLQAEKFQSLALMAGGIAHDFNNLLTVIIGNAACIAADVPSKSKVGGSVADLRAAADRAAQLVAQLLAFTGRSWYDVRPVALSDEIAKMMPHIREMVPPRIAIRCDLAPDLPFIQAGTTELQHVMDSLISNAVDSLAESKSGSIEIRTNRSELSERDIEVLYPDRQLAPGRYVRLEVRDTGCGIPDEILNRVFDPFFTTKFVGRGLGLSAVQGILRAHGGAIRLDSTLDHGTQVELVLPEYVPAAASLRQVPIPV